MLKNPHCSMAISAKDGSKFAALINNGDVNNFNKYINQQSNLVYQINKIDKISIIIKK